MRPEQHKKKTIRKRVLGALLALGIVLVAVLSAGCDVIEEMLGDIIASGLDELLTQGTDPGLTQETDFVATIALTPEPTPDLTPLPTAEPTATNVPTATATATATAPAGFVDDYVPGYGGNVVRVNKTNPGEPLRYWRATLKDPAQVAAYDSLEETAKNHGNVAMITRKISFEDFKLVYEKFMLDHPEIFWYNNNYHGTGYTNDIKTIEIEQKYSENQIKLMQNGIDDVTRQILSRIPDGASDFEAEQIIFEWLAANVQYDLDAPNAYTMYGALVDRRCVCEGYAEAFQYLCGKVGIPATSITGTAYNGKVTEKHKWNAAKIGGNWYLVEPTWANVNTTKRFLYLNCSGYIAATHTPKDYQLAELPSFTATAADYLSYYGLVVGNTSDELEFDTVFMRAVAHFVPLFPTGNGSVTVLLRATNDAAAQKYSSWISDYNESRVGELMKRLNAGYDRTYVIWGDPEILEGNIVAFKLARY
jgi:hypothetical protein